MDLSDCDEMLGEKEFIHSFSKYLSVSTVCEAVVGIWNTSVSKTDKDSRPLGAYNSKMSRQTVKKNKQITLQKLIHAMKKKKQGDRFIN